MKLEETKRERTGRKREKENGEREKETETRHSTFVTAHDVFVHRRVPVRGNFRFAKFSYVHAIKPSTEQKASL